jgi:monoamine oxidase
VPTWWTQYPEPHALLTGWISGSKARVMASRSDKAIINTALSSLATIFEMDIESLRKELQAARVMNWTKDPYTLGSYSFATVHADQHQKTLMTPVQDTLFFAGEHLMEPSGTVEAALKSGLSVAQRFT